MTPALRVISLGAGVQSTTMALMAARGELAPMPDCAIFADTGWEPAAVYVHLDKLVAALPFPVYRVSGGNLRADALRGESDFAKKFAAIPWHLRRKDGSMTIGKRECTNHYKLRPIYRKIVELSGGRRRKGGTEVWVGISTDEAFRMRPARVQYIANRWPLIEARMSRLDCRAWLGRLGWTAPKSSCIGCPLRSHAHWRALRPEEIADAVEVDTVIRQQAGAKGAQFMHFTGKPLASIDLSTEQDRGQLDLFINECEGLCGV